MKHRILSLFSTHLIKNWDNFNENWSSYWITKWYQYFWNILNIIKDEKFLKILIIYVKKRKEKKKKKKEKLMWIGTIFSFSKWLVYLIRINSVVLGKCPCCSFWLFQRRARRIWRGKKAWEVLSRQFPDLCSCLLVLGFYSTHTHTHTHAHWHIHIHTHTDARTLIHTCTLTHWY